MGIFEEMEKELEELTKGQRSSTFNDEEINDDPKGESKELDKVYGGDPPQPVKVLTPAQYSELYNAVMASAGKGGDVRPQLPGPGNAMPTASKDMTDDDDDSTMKKSLEIEKMVGKLDKGFSAAIEKRDEYIQSMEKSLDDKFEKLSKAIQTIGAAVKEIASTPTMRKGMDVAPEVVEQPKAMNKGMVLNMLTKGVELGKLSVMDVSRFEATQELTSEAQEYLQSKASGQ